MNGSVEVFADDGVTVIKRHSPHAPKALFKYSLSLKKKKVIDPDLDYNEAIRAALVHALTITPTYAAAAKEIGISTTTMFRWTKAWGIKVER